MLWNIGNTTVRNPNRIQDGLRVFADEFQGNLDGRIAEQNFARRLASAGVVELSRLEGDVSDLGRKWRSCFTQLGFASYKSYGKASSRFTTLELASQCPNLGLQGRPYELTPIGRRLLEADTFSAIQDIFLRQLVRYEIPSPIESRYAGFRIKPFIYLLQVLKELKNRSEDGLSYVEIGVFIQPTRNHDSVSSTVDEVLAFRREKELQSGTTAKLTYENNRLRATSGRVGLSQPNTLRDYADTTSRYCRMTGLISLKGSRLILRDEKLTVIEKIIENEPTFLSDTNPIGYLEDFYIGTHLPFDDTEIARSEILKLIIRLNEKNIEPHAEIGTVQTITEVPALQQIRYKLEEQFQDSLEDEFARRQSENDQIEEIINYLKALVRPRDFPNLLIDDKPAYFEWAVWRAYLAINHINAPPSKTRRFPVDADFRPRGNAPGGGADMVFPFADFILGVEVTLTRGSRQEAVEGEPVRRHIADVKLEHPGTDTYGVFIAPEIDNNTAETFRIGAWYRGDEIDFVNVVPFKLEQFIQMMEIFKRHRFQPTAFKNLLDQCLVHRNAHAPDWKRQIGTEISRWNNSFMVSG